MPLRRRTLLLAPAAASWAAAATAADAAAEPGAPVRWPALRLLDGRTLPPAAWHDHAAVVVFWASWCAFCKRHNARIEALHRASQGQPLRVLGIALDTDAAAARRRIDEQGWTFPVALDDGLLRPQLTHRRVLPTTCVVARGDRGGRPLLAIPGEMAADDVLALPQLLQRRGGL